MTILFVPGFMTDNTLWTEVISHMDSNEPFAFAELGTETSISGMARVALRHAPASFVLVGFSMGGYVAREMARLAPERVRALILIATSARADTPIQAQRKLDAVRQISTAPFRGLTRASIKASLHAEHEQNQDLIDRMRTMSLSLGKDVFIRQAGMQRESDVDRLSEINCPTLIIAAEEDRIRSMDESQELHERIPNAEMMVIDSAGHMLPLEAPGRLACVISGWFGRQEGGFSRIYNTVAKEMT